MFFNWLLFTSFVFSFILSFFALGMDLIYHFKYQPKLEALRTEQGKMLKKYQSLTLKLEEQPYFSRQPRRQADLSQLFSEMGLTKTSPLVNQDVIKNLLSLGHHWMEKRHKIEESQQVQYFMSEVLDYDHWQLTPEEVLRQGMTPSLFPVASQLHLASVDRHNPEAILMALTQARHLSSILINTESSQFQRAGLSILNKERDFVNFLNQRRNKAPVDWELIDMKVINDELARQNIAKQLLSLLTPAPTLEALFLSPQLPRGFCAWVEDRLAVLQWQLNLLKPRFIFEPNFSKEAEVVESIIDTASERCPMVKNDQVSRTRHWAQYLPFYRRLYALNASLTKASSH